MIYIFCGEDTLTSRAQYLKEIEKYKASSAEIVSVAASSIVEVYKGISQNLNLFSGQTVFCVENLEKFGFKKSTKAKADKTYEALLSLAQNKDVILLDFEDGKQARQLKLKDLAKVVESKPSMSIFKLVEECFPENRNSFIQSLRVVCQTQDEQFIFIMLYRHVRQLIMAQDREGLAKLPPWQKFKIIAQSKKWQIQRLMDFYNGLIKIEVTSKTSSNPYGIANSLEILACHYL